MRSGNVFLFSGSLENNSILFFCAIMTVYFLVFCLVLGADYYSALQIGQSEPDLKLGEVWACGAQWKWQVNSNGNYLLSYL